MAYAPDPKFKSLYDAYTGPDSTGQHLTKYMVRLTQEDPILIVTGADFVIFPGSGKDPIVESFRHSTRGFVELTAISHIGAAIAWIFRLRDLGYPTWRDDATRLIERIDKIHSINTDTYWKEVVAVEAYKGYESKIADLIETKVVPHFNFVHMTRIAMARNWRVASPDQQKELTGEFKTLLVRTYSTALSSYRDQQIDYKPLRAKPEDTEVTVRSEVKQSGSSQPVGIDYEMEKTPGGWKVYDVKVGGVSLVTTYRDTFASEVRERGVDGLIKSLATKNRQSERPKQGKT